MTKERGGKGGSPISFEFPGFGMDFETRISLLTLLARKSTVGMAHGEANI